MSAQPIHPGQIVFGKGGAPIGVALSAARPGQTVAISMGTSGPKPVYSPIVWDVPTVPSKLVLSPDWAVADVQAKLRGWKPSEWVRVKTIQGLERALRRAGYDYDLIKLHDWEKGVAPSLVERVAEIEAAHRAHLAAEEARLAEIRMRQIGQVSQLTTKFMEDTIARLQKFTAMVREFIVDEIEQRRDGSFSIKATEDKTGALDWRRP